MNDGDIVAGLLRGSAPAADALIDRFAQPLTRYFAVHLPDPSQAEDMVQEVFLRLLGTLRRTAESGQPCQVRSLYSLLFTIARHLMLDVRKTAGRRPKLESLDAGGESEHDGTAGPILVHVADMAPDPRQQAAADQQQKRMDEAIRRLSPEFRDVLVLRHVQGLNGREIAEVLGIPEGTVWSRLGRALQELRATLADTEEESTPPTSGGTTSPKSFPKGGTR